MSSPNSEANWRNYVSHFCFQPCSNTHPTSSHEELQQPGTSCATGFRSILFVVWHCHTESVASPTYAINSCSSGLYKWLKELPLSEPKRKVLTDNIAKTEEWWAHQPSEAIETVERVAVMMGIPVSLLGKNYDALNLLRVMTAAISLTN